MIIELTKDWNISTDETNFTLNSTRVVKEGDNAGNTYEVAVGYYGTLEASLKGFIKHSLRKDQDTVVLKKVGEKIEELYSFIKGIKVENLDPKIVKKDEVDKSVKDIKVVKVAKADSKETKGNISKESKSKTKSKGELAKENLDKKSKETKATKTTKAKK